MCAPTPGPSNFHGSHQIFRPGRQRYDGVAMADILLTADRALMNDFHLNWDLSQFFYGQGESLPGWYMGRFGEWPPMCSHLPGDPRRK